MRIRTILKAAAVPAIIAGGLLATSAGSAAHAATLPANANSTQITFTTHDTNVADTTWGSALGVHNYQDPTYGPVWAYDNLERVVKITQTGDQSYTVELNAHGSYSAIADPRDGNNLLNNPNGPVDGVTTYYVTSISGPAAKGALPKHLNGAHTGDIMNMLFKDYTLNSQTWHWTYVVDGQTYHQDSQ
jgi:hypothetical protein